MLRPTTAAATVADPKRWRWLLASCAALLLLAISSVPAIAATGHKYVATIGAWGSGSLEFNGIQGIATVPSSGDLLVADMWNSRIQRISAGGDLVAVWPNPNGVYGVAVDEANDRVYVTEQGATAVEVFTLAGVSVGQLDPGSWGSPSGVAVDQSNGDVYVVDALNGVVKMYDASGASLGSFGVPGGGAGEFNGPSAIAVDNSSHDVYVVDWGNGTPRVQQFTALGASVVGELSGTVNPLALAVDQSNGDVYVGESGLGGAQVARYDSSGVRQYAFGQGRLMGVGGLAVTPTHRVYVTDNGDNTIKVFATVTVPAVTTDPATNVTATDATLNGTVNPADTTVYYGGFDYGTDTNYGQQAYVFDPLAGNSDIPIAAPVSFLVPNTTYHYRAWVFGAEGMTYGGDQTFTTDPAAPEVGDAHGDPVTTTSATIHGQVNANNSATTYYVEYGTTAAYGSTTSSQSAGSGYGMSEVTQDLTGLTPGTVYHYRVVANNGTGGDIAGPDETFKTASAATPDGDASAVSATLEGVVDVRGSGTYHFEYGTTTAYGESTADAPAEATDGDQVVMDDVEDLEPGTTYHVRVVWTTAGGDVTYSDDGTLTTLPAPDVVTGDATDVGTSSATLHGTVDTHGVAGTFRFRVTGVNSTVVRETPEQDITSDGPADVAAAVGDLPDDHDYEVVLEATVGGATVTGDATTFTTAKLSVITPRAAETPGNPYGCAAPHLNDATKPATAGQAYTLTGSDLGVGGQVNLGDSGKAEVSAWSAGAITFVVPDDASGKLTVSVNCGNASNSVTLSIAVPPSNAVSVLSASAKRGRTVGSARIKVAGAGQLRVRGNSIATVKKVLAKGGTYRVTLRLTRKGRALLRKHGSVAVSFTAEFTPTGGSTGSDLGQVTFRRKATRHHH